MNRRKALNMFTGGGAGLAATMAGGPTPLQAAQSAIRRGLPPLKITNVKTILTQPAGDQLVIVKVETSEPGLYGIGCATHRERPLAVAAALDQYMKPFVVGRNVEDIEDIWQSAVPGFSGYGVSQPTSEAVLKMRPQGVASSPVFEPTPYVNNTIKMFDQLRSKMGFDVELVHDMHERLPPTQALVLLKAVEPYRPFFMEDAFAPEDVAWFQI